MHCGKAKRRSMRSMRSMRGGFIFRKAYHDRVILMTVTQ
jgi:hypothetical protein